MSRMVYSTVRSAAAYLGPESAYHAYYDGYGRAACSATAQGTSHS